MQHGQQTEYIAHKQFAYRQATEGKGSRSPGFRPSVPRRRTMMPKPHTRNS